jgi:hypothetical protein
MSASLQQFDTMRAWDDAAIAEFCRDRDPVDILSFIDRYGLVLPLLSGFFSEDTYAKFSDPEVLECVAVAIFTPSRNFELERARLSYRERDHIIVTGIVRVKNPVGPVILLQHGEEKGSRFSIVRLPKVQDIQTFEAEPSYRWIDLEQSGATVLAEAAIATHDGHDVWKKILDDYCLIQARVMLQFTSDQVLALRRLLDDDAIRGIGFATSQILSVTRLSVLESHHNLVRNHVELAVRSSGNLEVGLTALNSVLLLAGKIDELGRTMKVQLGGAGALCDIEGSSHWGWHELCSGGQFMTSSLLYQLVVADLYVSAAK